MPTDRPAEIRISERVYATHDPAFRDEKERKGRYILTVPKVDAAHRICGTMPFTRWDPDIQKWWQPDGWPDMLERELRRIEEASKDQIHLRRFRKKIAHSLTEERNLASAHFPGKVMEHEGVLCKIAHIGKCWTYRRKSYAMAELVELSPEEITQNQRSITPEPETGLEVETEPETSPSPDM